MTAASITLIIPTYNRSPLLLRLLAHLAENKWTGPIYISDSSEAESLATNQEIVSELKKHLNLTHLQELPAMPGLQKWSKAVSIVQTEFTVLCADDDLILPTAILECVEFLRNNSDYTVCHGVYVGYTFRLNELQQKDLGIGSDSYSGSRDESLALERFLMHLHNFAATIYGVHRTPELQYAFNTLATFLPGNASGHLQEFLHSVLVVIRGKIKRFPHLLYSVRKGWPSTPGWAATVVSPNFSAELEATRKCIVQEIVAQNELSPSDALELFDACFIHYLPRALGTIPLPKNLSIFESVISRPLKCELESEKVEDILAQSGARYQAVKELILLHG